MSEDKIFKQLTDYDTSTSCTIVLPKRSVENTLLPYIGNSDLETDVRNGTKDLEVAIAGDIDGRTFPLRLTHRNNKYMFRTFGAVVRAYNLKTGDFVEFYPKEFNEKLFMGFKFSPSHEFLATSFASMTILGYQVSQLP
ncbi:hypothetical protein L1987_86315 [Smallanthus sonchifolius]|uniref:Uncharacterized protein n=1 Tax=Smallanthus sonchifolius TaxID=185202 RepID=A0ACB8XZR3_9ASTR|nr:hypothetical protein L1987_86315 [Smallanthus sonchifolius]